MGWTEIFDTPHKTRAEMVREELSQAPAPDSGHAWGFEYMTERGSTVYAVAWHESNTRPRHYYGMVILTSRRAGFFGYKDMTEDAHPYYYDAPVKMLDMLDRLDPQPTEQAAKWRQKCREHQAAKKTRTVWQAGDRIEYGREEYTLKAPAGRARGWIVEHHGTTYRLPARALSKARKLEPNEQAFKPTKEISAEQFMREHFTFIHVGG